MILTELSVDPLSDLSEIQNSKRLISKLRQRTGHSVPAGPGKTVIPLCNWEGRIVTASQTDSTTASDGSGDNSKEKSPSRGGRTRFWNKLKSFASQKKRSFTNFPGRNFRRSKKESDSSEPNSIYHSMFDGYLVTQFDEKSQKWLGGVGGNEECDGLRPGFQSEDEALIHGQSEVDSQTNKSAGISTVGLNKQCTAKFARIIDVERLLERVGERSDTSGKESDSESEPFWSLTSLADAIHRWFKANDPCRVDLVIDPTGTQNLSNSDWREITIRSDDTSMCSNSQRESEQPRPKEKIELRLARVRYGRPPIDSRPDSEKNLIEDASFDVKVGFNLKIVGGQLESSSVRSLPG